VAHQLGLPHAAADAALRGMLTGALATLLDSDLTPTEVMDLVPVKPLSDLEPVVTSAYRTALPSLHARIRPGEAQPHTA
jgi:pyrroline-5-carboxylate reductase